MDVFFDEQIFVSQEHGGISRYFTELALQLGQSSAVHAHVLGGITHNGYMPTLRGAPGVTAHWVRRRDRLRINTAVARLSRWWARRAFARLRRRSEALVYHATNYALDSWMAARADAVCVTVFDMIGELFGDAERRARSLEQKRHAVTAADAILCISEQTRRDLVSLVPECHDKATVTLLAASLPDPKPQDLSTTRQFAPYLLMVGKRHGYKNGTIALQAFFKIARQHPDLRLICFGGEALSQEEEELLRKVRSRVMAASGSDGLLAAYYANAVGLLYPSRYEGFGLPVLEAMQLGCPVLTTRCASLPEVGGTAAVYLDPDDVARWAQQADRLFQDSAWRQELIDQGRARARQFSWHATAQQTRAAYERGLKGKHNELSRPPSPNQE